MSNNQNRASFTNLEAISLIHQVAALYMSTKFPRDYGTGEKYTVVEVHTLQDIAELPAPTITDLAVRYGKTKGAVSQMIKKLESKDLIYRVPSEKNNHRYLLKLTERGRALNEAHCRYDNNRGGEVMDAVRRQVTEEDFNTAFRVLGVWLEVRRRIHQQRIKAVKQK